jgi:hypothetical protein
LSLEPFPRELVIEFTILLSQRVVGRHLADLLQLLVLQMEPIFLGAERQNLSLVRVTARVYRLDGMQR